MVSEEEKQLRSFMLYEFRRGVDATTATKNICSVQGEVLPVRKCQMWFARFKSGNFDLNDKPKTGRPLAVRNANITALVNSDNTSSTRAMAARLKVRHTTVLRHLRRLNYRSKRGQSVPHELTEKNKKDRMRICKSLLDKQRSEPFLERIITCDEKWVKYNNVGPRKQWLLPGQKPNPTPKDGLHPKKVMLCVWWDVKGIIYFELLEDNQTVDKHVYCHQLDKVMSNLATKRPSLANRKGVIFHQDNARPHKAEMSMSKINSLGWEVMAHPPYSPDIAPSDYHLFRSVQHFLKDKIFESTREVEAALWEFFSSKPEEFYLRGIELLPERWQTIIGNNGEYIVD